MFNIIVKNYPLSIVTRLCRPTISNQKNINPYSLLIGSNLGNNAFLSSQIQPSYKPTLDISSALSNISLHPSEMLNSQNDASQQEISRYMRLKDLEMECEKRVIEQENIQLLQQKENPFKVTKFQRNVNISVKMNNSSEFAKIMGQFLSEEQYRRIRTLLKNYNNQEGFIEGKNTKPTKRQRTLFKNVTRILQQTLEDPQLVEEAMRLFARCNPKFIELDELKKARELRQSMSPSPALYHKFELAFSNDQSEGLKPSSKPQISNQSSIFSQISQTQVKKGLSLKLKERKKRLVVRKDLNEPFSFQANEANLQMVPKKIFGNKKVMNDLVVFKRGEQKKRIEANYKFGENWVYAYDLPYDIDKDDAQRLIEYIRNQYGAIAEYSTYPYKNMIEKNEEEIIFVIPDEFLNKTDNHAIIQKVKVRAGQIQSSLIAQPNQKKEKSLTSKILKKKKSEKDMALNKSSMVFKFKDVADKQNFLSQQMRLYGLNIGRMSNIKFEDAQSKKVVALSMVPWGCESSDMIRLINSTLEPLNVTVTHPNCIMAKSYMFIELSNFYEALYAKDLLNNLIFQNTRLKAQLAYGPSQIVNGQYKYSLQRDHYEYLIQKLSDLRSHYNQIHQ